MRRAAALVLVAMLAAGCIASPQPVPETPAPDAPGSCPWSPGPRTVEVLVSGYHLRSPEGYREGARYHEFAWASDPRQLTRIELELQWTPLTPVTDRLMLGIPNATRPWDYYAYGPYQGQSPIEADIPMPDIPSLPSPLQVDFGADQNQTMVGGVAEPQQPANLTLRETYDPCLRRG